jgi:adenylylsulfate kinase
MLILTLTGLSGAGKSTLALALCEKLVDYNYQVEVIDGDAYRHTLNKDLGFSEADRRENIRRLMLLAEQKKQQGFIVLLAAINPFEDQRLQLAAATGALTIYIHCALPVLIERDTKGLYKRALLPDMHTDKLTNLTGVNARYDVPAQPDFIVDTAAESIEEAAKRLCCFVLSKLKHPVF